MATTKKMAPAKKKAAAKAKAPAKKATAKKAPAKKAPAKLGPPRKGDGRYEKSMADKEARRAVFQDAFEETGLTRRELTLLMELGPTGMKQINTAESRITEKLGGYQKPGAKTHPRAPSRSEILLMQLMAFMNREGYDLAAIEFDEVGRITRWPTK